MPVRHANQSGVLMTVGFRPLENPPQPPGAALEFACANVRAHRFQSVLKRRPLGSSLAKTFVRIATRKNGDPTPNSG